MGRFYLGTESPTPRRIGEWNPNEREYVSKVNLRKCSAHERARRWLLTDIRHRLVRTTLYFGASSRMSYALDLESAVESPWFKSLATPVASNPWSRVAERCYIQHHGGEFKIFAYFCERKAAELQGARPCRSPVRKGPSKALIRMFG